MNNELLLLSGVDIPFPQAQVNIHQPTIKEISIIGEEIFWSGCQFLNFSKSLFDKSQDKTDLDDKSDFEIFMSIIESPEAREYKNKVTFILALLFPEYEVHFKNGTIILLNEKGIFRIDNINFEEFKDIISSMFGLNDLKGEGGGFDPVDQRASKIAEKLQRARDKKNKSKDSIKKVAILSRYVSILATGANMDMNILMNYTVFQLKDVFKRYQMKQAFDMHLQAKMAGATDLDDVDNWMDDIHS